MLLPNQDNSAEFGKTYLSEGEARLYDPEAFHTQIHPKYYPTGVTAQPPLRNL